MKYYACGSKGVALKSVNISIFAISFKHTYNRNYYFEKPMKLADLYDDDDRLVLENCTLCPRECRVNRLEGETGYCGIDAGLKIASVCIHRGEEPPISGTNGICNIFFCRM